MFAHILDCHHTRFADHESEELYCIRCGQIRDVMSVLPEIRVYCPTCHYGRGYGIAQQAAFAAARAHHDRFPEHATQVRRGSEVIGTIAPMKISQLSRQNSLDIPF